MRNFVSLRGFIRSFRRSQGDFAACGRRVSFPAMGKKPKDRRGTAQDGHFVSIFALPPVPPFTKVTHWTLCDPSGAQNQECLGAIPSGPTGGLSGKKIGTGAILFLRLPLPNQRPGAVPAVGAAPCGRPQAFPLVGGRWLAFGQPDEGGLLAEAISGGSPKGLPYSILGLCRGGTLGRPSSAAVHSRAGRPVSSPYANWGRSPVFCRGGYQPLLFLFSR